MIERITKWHSEPFFWSVSDTLYCSIPFTWNLPAAVREIKLLLDSGMFKRAVAGGPGVLLLPEIMKQIGVEIFYETPFNPVTYHNPFATFTTRGCPNQCPFCAVPKIEGAFKELKNFTPHPIVCDNNFLASSDRHFQRVVNALKRFPFVDFNQGLDAELFTGKRIDDLQSLKIENLRFSFDSIAEEQKVTSAIERGKAAGFKKISIYLLYNFRDSIAEAEHKAELLSRFDVQIFPMRYQPLDALTKNSFVWEGWTEADITKFAIYAKAKRSGWGKELSYEEFNYQSERKKRRTQNESLDFSKGVAAPAGASKANHGYD